MRVFENSADGTRRYVAAGVAVADRQRISVTPLREEDNRLVPSGIPVDCEEVLVTDGRDTYLVLGRFPIDVRIDEHGTERPVCHASLGEGFTETTLGLMRRKVRETFARMLSK